MRFSSRLILQRYDATSIGSHRVSEVRAAFNFKAVQTDTSLNMEEAANSLVMSVKLSRLNLPEYINRHFPTCLCNAQPYLSVYPVCTFCTNNCRSRYRCRSGNYFPVDTLYNQTLHLHQNFNLHTDILGLVSKIR